MRGTCGECRSKGGGLWSAASSDVGDEDLVGVIGDLAERAVATDA
jgi:hypothetical protein